MKRLLITTFVSLLLIGSAYGVQGKGEIATKCKWAKPGKAPIAKKLDKGIDGVKGKSKVRSV